jgi:hypothetical protein
VRLERRPAADPKARVRRGTGQRRGGEERLREAVREVEREGVS